MTYDLIVVGGGPAGSAAAITASRASASVLLLERGKFPRHKVCGEFVSAESLDLLSDLLNASKRELVVAAPRIPKGRIFIDKAVLSAEIEPSAASIARFDLDSALWNASIGAGVSVRDETNVQSVNGTGPFRVTTAGESFVGRAVINATGRWSNLTSQTTRNRVTRERWVGIKAHFNEFKASPTVDLYFFNGGYCGVQPVAMNCNGRCRINACAMVRSDVATSMDEVLRCHPALQERSRGWTQLMDTVSTSPLVFHEPEPINGSILQVGDAATFVDPFIGDGISLALRSGTLAVKHLLPFFAHEYSFAQALDAYNTAYEEKLSPVFRNSSKLRTLLRWPGIVRKPVLSLLARTPAITRQLVRMTR